MASITTRLNIEKLDGNIVQKHRGSKQVGFKQLGHGVKTGVHEVHDEKHVWFEVKLQGAQGDHEPEVSQVSNDDTAVTQRQLKDKQPEEKTNTNCLVKEQEKEYQTGWKIKTGNVLDSRNQRLDDVTSKVVLYKNMGFNESEKYKKTFIGSGVGAGLQEVQTQDLIDYLLGRDKEQHLACELFGYREDSNEAAFAVAAVEKIYAHESFTFNNTVACESGVAKHLGVAGIQQQNRLVYEPNVTLFAKVVLYRNMGFNESEEYKKTFIGSGVARDKEQHLACKLFGYREDSNEAAFAVDAVEKIYAHESFTFNNTVACEAEIWATKGLLDKAKGNVLGLEIVKDQSGYTLRVSQSRPDIASTDVGMLDGFDRGLQTYVQVFVNFYYVMGRSITSGVHDTYGGCKEENIAKWTLNRVKI
nr:zinc finger, CCHC-type [Tanacetum cinerariifolium]